MSKKPDFSEQVLDSFRKLRSEIDSTSSEYDVRHRLIKYVVEGVLGYEGKDYQAEKNRTDIKLFDETHNLVLVVIETKNPSVDVREEKWKDQAFSYTDAFTKYVVLTNGLQLLVWRRAEQEKPIADLDFDAILGQKRFTSDKLTAHEKPQLASIWELTREELWSEKKYEDFVVSEKIDISTDDGFQKLMEKLRFVMNQLLMGYAVRTFNEYVQGYKKYQAELRSIEVQQKKIKGNKELEGRLEKEKRDLDDKNKRFVDFQRGYEEWLKFSGREDSDQSREIFCKETIYVLLNKLLLARICEDKGLVQKKLSNSGILRIRELFTYLKDSYKDLLDFAYRDISQLYSHVFERSIFDWYTEGNGELNKLLNRVLYVFNHFDFGQVNRDILGKLYEKYLPKEERKKLGGFYTPEEVIDYILDAVGYAADQEIEGKDLLDPACGSGGFLVRAVGRLIDRYRMKGLGPKEILNNVIGHIYGLDIDPFACHIAEMNLLFQVIDLYQKAKEEDPSYQLLRFNIYQSDSLEPPKISGALTRWQYPNARLQKLIQEKETVEDIKNRKFDFVVGNPPYIRKERIPTNYKLNVLKTGFPETYHGDNDLYVYFINRGIQWLKDGSKLGYIVSRTFAKTRYGQKIRYYIGQNTCILEYIDFEDTSVFAEVTNYPCILVLRKESDQKKKVEHEILVARVKAEPESPQTLLKEIRSRTTETKHVVIYKSSQSILIEYSNWTMIPLGAFNVQTKIERNAGHKLGEVCETYRGIKTGLNRIKKSGEPVLVIDEKAVRELKLENDLLKPTVEGEDVRRWVLSKGKFLVFPYVKDKDGYQTADVRNYPNLFRHLHRFKDELSNRYDIRESGQKWYELRKCSYYSIFESEKIVTPRESQTCNFSLDPEGYFCIDTCVVMVPKSDFLSEQSHDRRWWLRYIVGLLNSKPTEFYVKQIATYRRGRWFEFFPQYLARIPVKLPTILEETQLANEIVELVNHITSMRKKLNEYELVIGDFSILQRDLETSRLDDYPSVVFSLSSSSKIAQIRREESRIFLNLQDHIECKDDLVARYVEFYLKSIEDGLRRSDDLTKEVGSMLIPKRKEDLRSVLERYEKMQAEARDIPEKIKKLEQEIDERVYKLYGLSSDEIGVIEESIR